VNWGVVLQLVPPFFGLACSFDFAPNNVFQMGIDNTCDYVVSGRDEGVV